MRILIAGASGLIGSAVASLLARQGNEVVRLVRHAPSAGEVWWHPDSGEIDAECLEGFDGVVHLASMPWPARWTSLKQRIRANRIRSNRLLPETLASRRHKPHVLVCASGMGIYPSSGDGVITEESPLGSDFLALLQRDGEAVAMIAGASGIRVVNLRIPAVIGGAAIRRNVGRLGNGNQWNSWVSRDELAHIVKFVLVTDSLEGPVNPVSPNPVRNADFAAIISWVLGSRPGLPIPTFLLHLMLGEMADELLLASRRIEPCKLISQGYQFRFAELESALRHELELTQP